LVRVNGENGSSGLLSAGGLLGGVSVNGNVNSSSSAGNS
jgi:hypothetical protein